jgi:hypothetical protein
LRKHSRIYPDLKAEVNSLNREIKIKTALQNQFSWNGRLASAEVEDLSLFQLAKTVKKKFKPILPLKNSDDDFVFADKEKAGLIAASFLKAHQISDAPTCHSASVDALFHEIQESEINFPETEKTSLEEVKLYIKRLKVKKASGYDNISNRILKSLPDKVLSFLVEIFNACFRLGYFPTDWKVGKIIPIAKPGKDHKLAGS